MSWMILVFDSLTSMILWVIMLSLGLHYSRIIESKRKGSLETKNMSLLGGNRNLVYLVIFAGLSIAYVARLLFFTIEDSFLDLVDMVPRITTMLPLIFFPVLLALVFVSNRKLEYE